MFRQTEIRRLAATLFAALVMSSMAVGAAVGPAHPVSTRAA